MVRSGMIKAILDLLASHAYLAREDFKLTEFENIYKNPCLSVAYRYNTGWHFKFIVPKGKTKAAGSNSEEYWFNCTMNPGREAPEETLQTPGRDALLKEIAEWLVRLHEDAVSLPVVRQFAAHLAVLQQLQGRLDALENRTLSCRDISDFQARLDETRKELAEQLRQERADKSTLQARVSELERDIELLKQALESTSDQQWSEAFLSS